MSRADETHIDILSILCTYQWIWIVDTSPGFSRLPLFLFWGQFQFDRVDALHQLVAELPE
jgi:hypothetical protein